MTFMKFQCLLVLSFLLRLGGQVVDVGLGQKMHLLCKGRGKPVGKNLHSLSHHLCLKLEL